MLNQQKSISLNYYNLQPDCLGNGNPFHNFDHNIATPVGEEGRRQT